MKKFLKILLILVLALVIAVGGLLGWLTATEYRPAAVEEADVVRAGDVESVKEGETLKVLSWNVGYAGLGKGEDFFMDGGTRSKPDSRETVLRYLGGISASIEEIDPDLVLLQEVDSNSGRTYSIDERGYLGGGMSCESYALNYSCPFVPVPVPPIGKVNSGLYTMTDDLQIAHAERHSLPCPFSWPLRIANLKRCLLVSSLPIEGSDKQLVLVNLHLEAYDDGEGKIAQTKQLMDFLEGQYKLGNYVIAGGDFNQIFPGGLEQYPNEHPDLWTPGLLEEESLPEGFRYCYDLSVPSCRLLNQPYDPSDTANTQYYVIDGFIVSPNVTVENVEGLDLGFENADHNPVLITVTLG